MGQINYIPFRKLLFLSALYPLLSSCNVEVGNGKSEVDNLYPIGAKLDDNIYNSAEQIVKIGKYNGLLVNANVDDLDKNYYVLIFRNKILEYSFPSSVFGIDTIYGKDIFLISSPNMKEDPLEIESDFLSSYNLLVKDCGTKVLARRNKVIRKAFLSKNDDDCLITIEYLVASKLYYNDVEDLIRDSVAARKITLSTQNIYFNERSLSITTCRSADSSIFMDQYFYSGSFTRRMLMNEISNCLGFPPPVTSYRRTK